MRHILLFRTVRTEFLDFCVAACRRKFPDPRLILVAQSDAEGLPGAAGVDGVLHIPPGMISPTNMCREAMRELRALDTWVAVIPVYNPRLGFYRAAYRVARRTGARRVLSLGLDGRFSELTGFRFFLHRLMDWRGSKLLISFFLTPYILWLLLRACAATAGTGVRTAAGRR